MSRPGSARQSTDAPGFPIPARDRLRAGEAGTAATDSRFVLLLQAIDKFMRAGRLCRGDDFFFGGVGPAQANVFQNRSREHQRTLRYDGDGLTNGL